MKLFFLLLICIVCLCSQEDYFANEVTEVGELETDEQIAVVDENEELLVRDKDLVLEFFNRPGLALIPRSRTFSMRNVLSIGAFFESDGDRDGNNENDSGTLLTLLTEVSKNFGYLQFQLSNLIRYNDNFDIFPTASVQYQYVSRKFTFRASQDFSRSNAFVSLDEGLNDVLHTAVTRFSLESNTRRFSYGVNLSYLYRKSFDLNDEDSRYSANFFAGYNFVSGLFTSLNYQVSFLDDDVENVVAHSVLVGITFPLVRKVSNRLSFGLQTIDNQVFFISALNASWNVLPNLNLFVRASSNTAPAFNDVFQYSIRVGGGGSYVISGAFGIEGNIDLLYSEFDNNNVNYGAISSFAANYRLTSSVDLSFSYRLEQREGEQGENFANHRIIFSVNVIF
ncbi:hypothetical protein [Candidatus Uabimicrobium amorphum]|uniref:Porin domain-containing protein n=1 Tax=Uabimicrobium amorphum TaxID=2596890 RepID=A0A5S9IQV9_UABAM|nr:hypothetical protein [Candidatus Uabimicrobium amorphum]BBM86057.1 hypothetical protein UABAM_04443 [Candidatus Uabimicrobium amorphum]